MEVERELLRKILRAAAHLKPGNARRASLMDGYDAPQLIRLLIELGRCNFVIGVGVAGPLGDDFILAGLTRTGGQLLANAEDDEAWATVLGLAEDQWLLLTAESLAALLARKRGQRWRQEPASDSISPINEPSTDSDLTS